MARRIELDADERRHEEITAEFSDGRRYTFPAALDGRRWVHLLQKREDNTVTSMDVLETVYQDKDQYEQLLDELTGKELDELATALFIEYLGGGVDQEEADDSGEALVSASAM